MKRQIAWSAAGLIVPALIALVCAPALIEGYGLDGFAVLSITWAAIGFAGVLDLGLGRAVTRRCAELISTGQSDAAGGVTRIALGIGIGASVCASVIGWFAVPHIAPLFDDTPALQSDIADALRLITLAFPAAVGTSIARGALEGERRFALVAALRIPGGAITIGGPWVVLAFTTDVVVAIAVIVAGRWLMFLAHLLAVRQVQSLVKPAAPAVERRTLLAFGGWLTVSAVVSPLMNELDRVWLATIVPLAVVGAYAAAWEVSSRIWLITAAVTPVLFPAMVAALRTHDAAAPQLMAHGTNRVAALVFTISAALVLFARPGLERWVSADVAAASAHPLAVLAVAMFANVIAQIALTALIAAGRADIPAKLHMLELPLYAVALWMLSARWGATGAAVAWGARALVDATLLIVALGRAEPAFYRASVRAGGIAIAGTVLLAALSAARW